MRFTALWALPSSSRFGTTPSTTHSIATTPSLGRFERLLRISCADPNDRQNGRLRWQAVAPPDPAILLPGATRTATEQIELPVPAISPAGDVAINLGMWLAVEQAGPYVARAAFNDAVWAETTATLATTTFDFGDGTPPIVCDGRGTPIPPDQLDSPEPGPCGHVYTDHADIGPHTLTITVDVAHHLAAVERAHRPTRRHRHHRAARLRRVRGADGRRQRLTYQAIHSLHQAIRSLTRSAVRDELADLVRRPLSREAVRRAVGVHRCDRRAAAITHDGGHRVDPFGELLVHPLDP